MKKKEIMIILIQSILLLYLTGSLLWKYAPQVIQTLGHRAFREMPVVVIDAGHGGIDPGKVGIHGELEKDLNLQIAGKCREYLEQQNINVIMTRDTDEGLYKEMDTNKKIADMKQRVAIIEEKQPDLVVSIHQNSYTTEEVAGPQVFYYKDSLESKKIAELMQKQLNETLQPEKSRVEKDNRTYYLLKKTSVPVVIVECGFLSNGREASLLTTQEYQERIAWSVYLGIMKYINES